MLAHLLDISLRSLLLAIPVALALYLPGVRRTAAWEHAVCTSLVCGMLALFAFAHAVPRLPLLVLEASHGPVPDAVSSPAPVEMLWPSLRASAASPSPHPGVDWGAVATYLYISIATILLMRLSIGMLLVRKLLAGARPARSGVYESAAIAVPCTVGWLRPAILLPLEWREWSREKLDAVLAHEGAHVRRRDGLITLLAELNRCLFWFHPLAWLLQRKLALLAEQACDEYSVATLGCREQYAQVLLEMARMVDGSRGRLGSHALTMASASHIRQRIDRLVEDGRTFSRGLTWRAWAALSLCAVPAVAMTAAIDLDHEPPLAQFVFPMRNPPPAPALVRTPVARNPALLAQLPARTQAEALPVKPQAAVASPSEKFDVASIKPTPPPGPGWRTVGCEGGPGTADPGLFHCTEITLSNLISLAFRLDGYQFPGRDSLSVRDEVYDVSAKVPPGTNREQSYRMLQNLLIDRFKLTFHYEKREMAVYGLVVARGGIKMKPSAPESPVPPDSAAADSAPAPPQPNRLDADGYPIIAPAVHGRPSFPKFLSGRARWTAVDWSMADIARSLTLLAAMIRSDLSLVTDATSLTGKYDFTLSWVYDADEAARVSRGFSGPTLADALQQQLGLRLERTKGMVDVFIVDHVERPSGN